jgi:hypothetical protein
MQRVELKAWLVMSPSNRRLQAAITSALYGIGLSRKARGNRAHGRCESFDQVVPEAWLRPPCSATATSGHNDLARAG